MHVRPPCVYCHVRHPPTPGMCCIDCFHVGVLYGVGDGDTIIDTYAAALHVEIFPKVVNIGADLTSPVLVVR